MRLFRRARVSFAEPLHRLNEFIHINSHAGQLAVRRARPYALLRWLSRTVNSAAARDGRWSLARAARERWLPRATAAWKNELRAQSSARESRSGTNTAILRATALT